MLTIKIVTVNVPEAYIEAIKSLTGDKGLYPSRSELIRCAVREFLIKELQLAKNVNKYNPKPDFDDFDKDDDTIVRIPIEVKQENKSESTEEPKKKSFKTYKIIKRLVGNNETSKQEEHVYINDFLDFTEDELELMKRNQTHKNLTRDELRAMFPHLPDYKYVNEEMEVNASA